jgi:hypothetical protein
MNKQWVIAQLLHIEANGQLDAPRRRGEPAREQRERENRINQVVIHGASFENEQIADDYAEQVVSENPAAKVIKFEAVGWFEAQHRPPIKKRWNEQGELVIDEG